MSRIHVFEVVGELLLRPSGNAGFAPVPCKIVTTRCWRAGGDAVMFAELATGHERYVFDEWFRDWSVDDWGSGDDLQSGRIVETAIPTTAFNRYLLDGRPQPRGFVLGGNEQLQRQLMNKSDFRSSDMVQTPIAAVRMDGRWVFPRPAPESELIIPRSSRLL